MKPRTIILMVVAVVCGLGAAYTTSRLLANRGTEVREAEQVKIVVAKIDIDNATLLKEKNLPNLFEYRKFIKGEEPKDAFTSWDDLKGKFVIRNLRKGVHVTAQDIRDEHHVLQLPAGHQAIGIRVTAADIASGWASLPGSRVSIYWTVRGGTNDETKTIQLLDDVLVMAADQEANKGEGNHAMMASVVTLALKPEEVMRVNLAKANGELSLGLRRPDDKSKTDTGSVSLSDLLNGNKKKEINNGSPGSIVERPPITPNGKPPKLTEKSKLGQYAVTITVGENTRLKKFAETKDGKIAVGRKPGEVEDDAVTPQPQPAPSLRPSENRQPPPSRPAPKTAPKRR